jgi:hypothetical protein
MVFIQKWSSIIPVLPWGPALPSLENSLTLLALIHPSITFNGRHWSITHSLSIWFTKTMHIHTLCITSCPLCDYGILTVAMKHCLTYGIPLFNSTLPTLRVPFPSILFSRRINLDLQGMQLPCMVFHISLQSYVWFSICHVFPILQTSTPKVVVCTKQWPKSKV